MTEYRIGRGEERAELVDFANYVFSQAHVPHDFKTLIPKVYADHIDAEKMASIHYIAVTDGHIRGMVACPIIPISYAGQPLRVGLVGTVSTHPYGRGEGHMKKLMAMMKEAAREKGADMLALGGKHQRYQFFGFEQAGYRYSFGISDASVEKSWGKLPDTGLYMEKMGRDDPRLIPALALYGTQTVTGARTKEDFFDVLSTWRTEVWAILREEKLIGYLTAGKPESIRELVLEEEKDLPEVLRVWQRMWKISYMTLPVAPYETERVSRLVTEGESYTIQTEEQLCVLHWLPVLRACLALRAKCGPMPDTDRVLTLDGEKLHIQIEGDSITVEPTEAKAELVLDGIDAVRAVFHPALALTPSLSVIPGVFPLPLALPDSDKF